MWKTFCDMHCIEDAVLKGNSAILKSMKTQETHVVTTLHDMLKWYTTELFDKLKETQEQSSHNFKEQERVMKSYFEQMANMQTDYANQANTQIDQLGVDINQRFDENVVKPLNVLQQHLKTMNDNLLSLGTWLGNQDVFAKEGGGWTPPTSVLSSLSNLPGLPPHAEVQENFGAAEAALEGPASSPNASHAVLRLMRVSDYYQKASLHVSAHKEALLHLLSQNATQGCEPRVIEAGRLLAEMRRTEEVHVISLLSTWRSLAQNLDFLANLLVDGDLITSQLFAAASLEPNTTERALAVSSSSAPQLLEVVPLVEADLAHTVTVKMLPFVRQVAQAFDLSQLLADMWVHGSMEVPETELQLLQNAWDRAAQ
ncbi:unnamed protein product, partial [Symbiodinium necroappetens]